ncbi:MAG: hypothetical protein JWQ11_4822 [Rhizobacter sp.]|nr:hypothetical protein [Rhizobacter sp.]
MNLNTAPNLAAPDDFYQALIDTHRGLPTPRSHELNAKLVLLLSNHIGDEAVLREALAAARDSVARSATTQAG